MELALYHPDVGYYMRPAMSVGWDADFVTSPEVHPAFAGLLGVQIEEIWRQLGSPSPFWVVEPGPGRGTFVRDVLRLSSEAFPDFNAALRMGLIERSPALRALQQRVLGDLAEHVTWLDDEQRRGPLGAGCVFANEWLDALPTHRVVMRDAGLREVFVDWRQDRFVEVEREPSTPEIEAQILAGGGHLDVGQRGEVCLEAPGRVARVVSLLARGYVLILDYGAPADQLYGPQHPRGTFRCYRQQTMNEDAFAAIGLQDMTAHVDFSAVTRALERSGFSLLGATQQWRFLGRLGMPTLLERVGMSATTRAAQVALRRDLHALVDPHGLGQILALAFGLDAPDSPLMGFARTEPLIPPAMPSIWVRPATG